MFDASDSLERLFDLNSDPTFDIFWSGTKDGDVNRDSVRRKRGETFLTDRKGGEETRNNDSENQDVRDDWIACEPGDELVSFFFQDALFVKVDRIWKMEIRSCLAERW